MLPRHARSPLTWLLVFFLGAGAYGQTEHGGQPPSERHLFRRATPTQRMRSVDRAALLQEDESAIRRKAPLRFAEVLETDLDLENSGVWEELPNGDRTWRLRIESPGAYSIALVFSRFQLARGGELYVYDDERRTVRGAYTELENRLDGQFAIQPTPGDAINLEYYEPARVRGVGAIALALVVHDYRNVLELARDRSGAGGGGTCEIDVACPQGTGWQDQIDSAVHVLALPVGLMCSASLLNSTANDGTILVLSASHCGGLENAVFTFNFERPACGTGTAPTDHTIVGATQLVRDADLDFELLRLNTPAMPTAFPVYLAGWDRSDSTPTDTTIIHHPGGGVKKISHDDDSPGKSNSFWQIFGWDSGVTEGGSSGSPLFDQNKRFIGNLDSGSSLCTFPEGDDFCTRLAAIWSLVEPYLDPLGTGQTTMEGLDLALVAPQPFDATSVFPPKIPALIPGTKRPVRILGAGFDDTVQVAVTGQPGAVFTFLRGGHSWLNVDMPQLPIGRYTFEVTQNSVTRTVPFEIVAATRPLMQLNDGEKDTQIISFVGVDVLHADVPGHVHYCFWSTSNVPSVHPRVTFGLGNNFTQMRSCLVGVIPPEGFLSVHIPIRFGLLPMNTTVYSQSLCVTHRPMQTSNLEQGFYQL